MNIVEHVPTKKQDISLIGEVVETKTERMLDFLDSKWMLLLLLLGYT